VAARGPARQLVQSQALKFCRTCIPNVPISVPENSSDSGEPFPGPEPRLRRRKSRTQYRVGRKPAGERISQSFADADQGDNKSRTAGHRTFPCFDIVGPVRDDGPGGETEIKPLKHAQAAKVTLDGWCRCVLYRGALRRAVLERGASSCLGALPQLGGGCVSSVSGQRSPIVVTCD
jgi:hypothetical protein